MRKEGTHYRDKTFDFHRRRIHKSLYSTDLDAVEFFNCEPIDIREYKSRRSGWKSGKNKSITVQAKLAQRADLPYFVVEHDDDWENIKVYKVQISGWKYKAELFWEIGLQRYLMWLFEIRGLDYKREKPKLPISFEPITRQKVILRLWDELTQSEKAVLLQELITHS